MADWKPLFSGAIKPPEWKKLSSNALPSPADQGRKTHANIEANQKWQNAESEKLKQAQGAMQEEAVNRDWLLRTLPATIDLVKKTTKQLKDVQDEVAQLIVQNEALKLEVAQTKSIAESSGGVQLEGSSLILTDGRSIGWDWKRESFGVNKITGNRLWVHNGYIRGKDTYYFVDSQALTLSDTGEYIYASQNKSTLATGISKLAAMPDDTATEYRWPIMRLAKVTMANFPTGSSYTWAVRKIYNVGDVDEKANDTGIILDADGTVDATITKSLERKTVPGAHNNEGQIYEFDNHLQYTPNYDNFGDQVGEYQVIGRHLTEAGKPEVRYLSMATFKAYDAATSDYATSAGSAPLQSHRIEDHYLYEYVPTREKRLGDIIVAVQSGSEIGWSWVDPDTKFSEYAVGGDRWWPNTTAPLGNPSNKNYLTSGTLGVSGIASFTNATDAGAGSGGVVISGGVSITKKLRVEQTTQASGTDSGAIFTLGGVNVTKKLIVQDATATAISAPNGGLSVTKGVYAEKGTAGQAGYFKGITGQEVSIGNAVSALVVTDEINNQVEMGDGTRAINVTAGDYYHGYLKGATASDATYIAGGLVLTKAGKTLTLIDASDLQPTDKLAVWR